MYIIYCVYIYIINFQQHTGKIKTVKITLSDHIHIVNYTQSIIIILLTFIYNNLTTPTYNVNDFTQGKPWFCLSFCLPSWLSVIFLSTIFATWQTCTFLSSCFLNTAQQLIMIITVMSSYFGGGKLQKNACVAPPVLHRSLEDLPTLSPSPRMGLDIFQLNCLWSNVHVHL